MGLKDERLVIVAVPALIGMLPVPGGAVMSAPMTVEAGKKAGLSPEQQAAAEASVFTDDRGVRALFLFSFQKIRAKQNQAERFDEVAEVAVQVSLLRRAHIWGHPAGGGL